METRPALQEKESPGLKTVTYAATIGPVPWPVGDMGEDEKEVLMLRQAIAETDWDAVESHGGFNAVVEKIRQWEQENPVPKVRGSIDDFRLQGARSCRRMGDTATTKRCARRWCTILTITNLHYQRAKPLPLWSRLCPETRIGRGLARIPQILWGKAECGAGPTRPRLERRGGGAAREGEMVEGVPIFWTLVRHRRGEMVHAKIHHFPPRFWGSLPPQ